MDQIFNVDAIVAVKQNEANQIEEMSRRQNARQKKL